jgi:CRISPR-associated protein Cmr4
LKTLPYILHALSPLHAGTGHAIGGIDLPIARYRATSIPYVPGSTLKGVLRDRRDTAGEHPDVLQAVFGPVTERADENAGALTIGDARLLALPVRSFRGTFAWATSPLLLDLGRRDLAGRPGLPAALPQTGDDRRARVAEAGPTPADRSLLLLDTGVAGKDKIVLEDVDLDAHHDAAATAWATFLAACVFDPAGQDRRAFQRRFVVLDDDTMTLLWETGTQVDVRVSLDATTRTAKDGQLWSEESLPAETLLVGLAAADRGRLERHPMTDDQVLAAGLPGAEDLQVGG